ncbi:MAG TPA: tetratricopeptide repeat protein [Pirellulales bacterium]|jgi:tetratricopeptide (TPR) repeat protein|nr:tetratricopeptide repeat protein [Pirellulales bacterium]
MKRLNIKLVVVLVVCTVTAIVGVYFAHAFQYGQAAISSRQQAEALLKEGKRTEALRQYVVYLRQNDTPDPQVLTDAAQLAKSVAFEQPNRDTVTQAFELLREAIRQLPDNADLRLSYAELMMFAQRSDEAVEPLLWLTAPERGKHDPKFDIMLAQCYIQRSFYDKAVDVCAALTGFDVTARTFDEKKATAPHQIDAYDILAHLLRERTAVLQPQVADLVMDQLVAANKDSYRAHLQRARYWQQYAKGSAAKIAAAKKDLEAALKLAPNDPDVILVAAQSAIIEKKFDECQAILNRGLELYPTNVSMYRQWAILKSTEGKLGDAATQVEAGLKRMPDNPELLWMLCEIKLQQRDVAGARATLGALRNTKYAKPLIDLMDGRVLLFEGKWREAAQEFERLRPLLAQSPENTKQIDLYSAQCYGQLGEYDKQLDASQRVAQTDPTSYQAQVGIAMAYLSMGKTDEAKRRYDLLVKAVGKDKALSTPQIWRPIVQLRMDEQLRRPKAERDWTRVDEIIQQLDSSDAAGSKDKETDKAARSALALVKAEVELRKGDLDKARQILLDARKEYPAEPGIWSALATITSQTDSPAAALKFLDTAPPEIRDSMALRLNRAGILLRQGGPNVKPSLLAIDAGSDTLSAADRGRLWSGLGAAFLSLGEQDTAMRFWSKAADVSPDDLKIRFNLFDLARETGDEAMMSKIVEQFQKLMGVASAEARYADAARSVALVRKSVRERTPTNRSAAPLNDAEKLQLASARKLLEEVSQDRANWYEVARVMGDIEVLEGPGHENDAIADYQKALKLGPPSPLILRPLVLLLSRQNRTEEEKAALDLVSPEYVSELGLGHWAVETAVNSRDFPAAIARAKREVPDDSRDPSGHIWIAKIYERAGMSDEAEASFRRAVATGPDQPETWARLMEHLATHHKLAKIRDVLLEARKQLPEDRVNQVLGPGYALIGQYEQALTYYLAALEAAPDDSSTHRMVANFYLQIGRTEDARKEALEVLKLAANDPKQKPNAMWARRALADLLASTGKYPDFLKAKALLAENVQSSGSTDDKLRLAELLGERPSEPSQWREAVGLLESCTPLSPANQIHLAHLHELLGNWADARREMVNFVSEHRAGPAAYIAFIDMLIRHDEAADASSWLDRLDAVEPTMPGSGLTPAVALRSRILVKQGNTDRAVALLNGVLPSRPLPPDKLPLLRNVAMQMGQLGLNAAAEELFREYANYEPSGKLLLASFLGHIGRLDESLDLCEESLKTFPMPAVMAIAGEVFQSQPSHIQPKHIERVEKWYQRALRDDPESAPLLLQLAQFREISGNFDESERIYRGLLRRNDLDATQRSHALNNLAFSLAERKKDLAEALSFINEAAQLYGQTTDVLDTRGMVYVAMGDFPKALADLNDAVLGADPAPVKLLHLALAQDLSGDHAAAVLSFTRAKEQKLDPTALRKSEREFYDRLSKDLGP